MKKFYEELLKILTLKINDSYLLNSDNYLQLRFFIDSISQNESFSSIVRDEFNKVKNKEVQNTSNRSIDFNKVYNVLTGLNNSTINEFIRSIVDNKFNYATFNILRNHDFRSYLKLIDDSNDFGVDDGRIKFQYIYVTPTTGSYIMLVDNEIYLENLDDLRVRRGLREFTNLGNIKKRQEKNINQLNDDLEFESCYV